MGALEEDKKTEYTEGVLLAFEVLASAEIFAGSFVCVDANGYAQPGADTAGLIFEGVATEYVLDSSAVSGTEKVILRRRGLFKALMGTAITIANVGDNVFLADDQTVDLTANVNENIFCGIIAGYIDTTHAWIDIEPAIRQADVATHIASAAGAHAASAISVADAGLFTELIEVEAALQEIYQHIITTKGIIAIPMPTITDAGVALAVFGDAEDPLPGFCVTSKGLGIRWNNHGTPTPVGTKVMIPPDMNILADATLHILAAKIGDTVGDATKFTIQAFNNVVATLYDADDDFGGDTDAMVGNAATKTVQHVTFTLVLASLAAYPAALELTLQPKDGTLGTDDVIMLSQWIEYKRKALTS